MKRILLNRTGFTMIELITAIVIVGIISAIAGLGLVQLANGYFLAKKSTAAAQQSQIALTRLGKELSSIQNISSATATGMTYTRAGSSHTIAWTGVDQPLTLDGDTLIDKVQSFTLTYHNTYSSSASSYSSATVVIEVTFQLKGYSDITLVFVERVAI